RGSGPGGGGGPLPVMEWQARAHDVDVIAAIAVQSMAVQNREENDSTSAYITPNYTQMLGVEPLLGRRFRDEDAAPGAPPVAMISYGLWQRKYGGRSDV